MHRAKLLEIAYEQLKGSVEAEIRNKSSHSSQKQLSKSIVDLTEVSVFCRTRSHYYCGDCLSCLL